MTMQAVDPSVTPSPDAPALEQAPAIAEAPLPVAGPAGDMVLSIPFNAKDAVLLDRVARMRLGVKDVQIPVNLGEYIRRLINQDTAACIKEIQARRGG